MKTLGKLTNGYSFADLNAVVKDAAMGPIRDISFNNAEGIVNMQKD